MKRVKEVQEVSWHRNGISGVGFYAVRFTADIEPCSKQDSAAWNIPETAGESAANFLAIVFDEPGMGAVICLDRISTHGVQFGGNAWRGDDFEPELREAIETMPTSGGVRIGPFCLPT